MAKIPASVLGIDLGRYAFKAVLLQRRGGNRCAVGNFAAHVIDEKVAAGGDAFAEAVRNLVNEADGGAKGCAVAVSSNDSILRIIEQPETPPALLRNALRLNGMVMLNQDVRDFVLDCDLIPPPNGEAPAANQPRHYVVGGLPRTRLAEIDRAFDSAKRPILSVQLGSISAFNAFEFAKPEIFQGEPFILVDMGHASSTVTVGVKGHLILVRTIEYGGKVLVDALAAYASGGAPEALQSLEAGDDTMTETARMSLSALTREVSSSIGFFEGRREETISHIFVSGGPARSQTLLNLMSEELHMPCEAWHPFEKCEIAVPADRKALFAHEAVNLSVACGAAVELIRRSS